MSRQRWTLTLILIFAVVLAACQPTAAPTPTTRPPATAVPPTEEVVGESTEAPTVGEATLEAPEVATDEVTAEGTETAPVGEATETATAEGTETVPVGEATEVATAEGTETAPVGEATEEGTVEATEAPTDEVTPELGSVLAVAGQAGDFSTLLAAIDAAGLTETLEGSGPFTIFAPTDNAFTAMLDLAGISADDLLANANLGDILRYHVIPGEVTADDLQQYRSNDNPDEIIVPTLLSGKNLSITFGEEGNVIVNGLANVTVANVEAGNGIIHVIDSVLVPPPDEVATEEAPEVTLTVEAPTEESTVADEATEAAPLEEETAVATEAATEVADATPEATEAPTDEVTPEVGNLIEVARQAGDFTTLLAALDQAGLTETLEGDGPFTLFAPTDDAFAELLETLDIDEAELLARPELGNILLYHVYAGDLSLDDLTTFESGTDPGEYIIPTVIEGDPLIITFDEDGTAIINGVAEVTVANVEAGNGVIYVIDAVLLPSSVNLEATEAP